MDIRKLQRVIVDGLEDVKAQNIVVFNTEHLSPLFERVIVASGTSNRQTKALAASVRDAVRAAGAPPPRTEGEANGEWIIVDCGAAVVHVMQPAIREYYHLEEIWGDKPVKMKIDAATPRLVKAARRDATSAASREAAQAAGPRPSGRRRRRASRARQAGCGRPSGAVQAGRSHRGAARAAPSRRAGAGVRPAAKRAAPKRKSVRALHAAAMKLVLVAVGQRLPAWAQRRLRRIREALSARAAPRAQGGEGRAARFAQTPRS